MQRDTPKWGLWVPPCWRIVAPGEPVDGRGHALVLSDGPGFGGGGHPTTQLCLQAIAALAPRDRPGWTLLDFGCGTGILSLAASRLGARATGLEIDPQALATARTNAALNGMALELGTGLAAAPGPYDVVVANILRPVLLAHAADLAARVAPGGVLVMSGLVATDLPDLTVELAPRLGPPERFRRDDWWALVWRASRP